MISIDEDVMRRLLTQCADEPICTPGAIQPHGLLLTLSDPELRILQISANVDRIFGLQPSEVIGAPLSLLLGDDYASQVMSAAIQANPLNLPGLPMILNSAGFEGFIHRHQGALVLELEPLAAVPTHVLDDGNSGSLGRILQRLHEAESLDSLYEISVQEIQAVTGYDRVLIYRFEDEGHGQVIAEASSPTMESFRGLFFPASDIPAQARELYRTNWIRIIPDADYQPVPLVPELRPDTQRPLDLSFASLRSVSPIHCQYMRNMGVLSSMSISLIKGDKLWGLISCGHRTPMLVPPFLRNVCKTVGQVLSLQISAMESLEIGRQREEKLEMLQYCNELMSSSPEPVFETLTRVPETLLALTKAVGVAIIDGMEIRRFGRCPESDDILLLHEWLQTSAGKVFSSHQLSQIYPPAKAFENVASGVLAISLPKPVKNGVIWFRPEVKESIPWSGNPQKPIKVEDRDGSLSLRPRTSFEVWKVEMSGVSEKWTYGDLFAANDLRRSALECDLAHQVLREQKAVQARDDLVAVVSHDLRNPMTVISMLCGMMQKAFSSDGQHTSRRISTAIDTMQQATARMNMLLDDLLDTSKIDAGRYTISPQQLMVQEMFHEANSLLSPLALAKDIEISFHSEPDLAVSADPERLFQVLSNLVGNAIKFTPRQGKIRVTATAAGNAIIFSVCDTGEGIAEEQLSRVFDRYWTTKEGNPTGTGLGLYITRGIVEAHGGNIVAYSNIGEGSEFRFTLPIGAATKPK